DQHVDHVPEDADLVGKLPGEDSQVPAAQEQDDGDAADCEHAAVFGHEEDQPAKAAVFGVEAGDQLAFGFGQIKGSPLATGGATGEEGPESAERKWVVK